MRTIEVDEISIDDGGRLLIRPKKADGSFHYVYRAAAEVCWLPGEACFACPRPRDWSYAQWFQHARDAVRAELGCDFEVNDRTSWKNVPDVLREEILLARVAG